jgi:sporulation-control protein
MFETLLAGAGVGSARIDLILDQAYVKVGETVTGKIVATGGKSSQHISGLSVHFCIESSHAKTLAKIEETVTKIQVTQEKFTIQPGEEKTFPFSFPCPHSIPISCHTTKYYFDTNLEIDWGRDSHDRDYIEVWPVGPLKKFLDSFALLGLKRTWEGLTNDEHRWFQWTTYSPSTHYTGHFEELTVCIEYHDDQEIKGYYLIDLDNRDEVILRDTFHLDEAVHSFHLKKEDLTNVEQAKARLQELIKKGLHSL